MRDIVRLWLVFLVGAHRDGCGDREGHDLVEERGGLLEMELYRIVVDHCNVRVSLGRVADRSEVGRIEQ